MREISLVILRDEVAVATEESKDPYPDYSIAAEHERELSFAFTAFVRLCQRRDRLQEKRVSLGNISGEASHAPSDRLSG